MKQEIARYWEWAFECTHNRCWACNAKATSDPQSIQRAHIEPHRGKGNWYCANIHLLCQPCHKMSEYFYGEDYWNWFTSMRLAHGLRYNEGRMKHLASRYDPDHISMREKIS